MSEPRLRATREQILSFRRRGSHLEARLAPGADSLRRAAWAGLQDSMPRAAVLSLHARVEAVKPTTWEDSSLIQVWGPRFSAFVVAVRDRAVFTMGRLPPSGRRRQTAQAMAAQLADLLGEQQMTYREAGRTLGVPPNQLRYAALTGTVVLRWRGAGKPMIRIVDAPDVDEGEARHELVRRYLHVFGPATAVSFSKWAGVAPVQAEATFTDLRRELAAVSTPVGAGHILARDEAALVESFASPSTARLLPSGDTYYLLQGPDRALLIADEKTRRQLWTSRVWPGAVLLNGEIVGTWRRNKTRVCISAWQSLSAPDREAIEAEARSFPLIEQPISVSWN